MAQLSMMDLSCQTPISFYSIVGSKQVRQSAIHYRINYRGGKTLQQAC